MDLSTGERRITKSARRAMKINRHAIEHLLEDWIDCGDHEYQGVLEAVEVLMNALHTIYCECPRKLSLFARFLQWIHLEHEKPEITVSVQKGEDRVQISCFSHDIKLVAGINGTRTNFAKEIEALLMTYAASNELPPTYSRSNLDTSR